MIIKPIIPIWLMAIICVFWLALKRKNRVGYLRQIAIILLIFVINLRIMIPDSDVKKQVKNMDLYVLFVIDNTISMLAEDYDGLPTRLDAVKEDCYAVIDKLYGSRFSTITYDNNANLMSPFTNDANLTKNVIASIYPISEFYAKGSSMNVCKDLLGASLKKAKDKENGKVVVFFISDGEITNKDNLESFADFSEYIDYGAVLGYGTAEGGEMHYKNSWDEESQVIYDNTNSYQSVYAKSKIDETNLKKIADDLGIEYVHMQKKGDLDGMLDRIIADSISSDKEEDGIGNKNINFIFIIPLTLLLAFELFTNKKENVQF